MTPSAPLGPLEMARGSDTLLSVRAMRSFSRRVERGLGALGLIALAFCLGCDSQARPKLEQALLGRGRVAVLGGDDLVRLSPRGTELLPSAGLPQLSAALSQTDPKALVSAMAANRIAGLLIDARAGAVPPSDALGARLASYARVPGMQGAYLSPMAALYVLDPVRDWSPALRAGLAEVARRLIAGEPPPHLRSFPEVVRTMGSAEVMVLLRSGSRARLWRSARGSSFARGLLTACEVARQRWTEREQAMGGPLDRMLPRMQVEVALLQDDGEIGSTDDRFVDRVVLPVHGVAYEQKGAWRYLLPEATHAPGVQSPSHAFARLFTEYGLPDDSLRSQELRPYRLAVQIIGISPAPAPRTKRKSDDVGEVETPDEVLGH
jgi:hypothetical protein